MKGTTHLLFAILFGVGFIHFYSVGSILSIYVFVVLLILGAEIPDMDLKIQSLKHRSFLHAIYIPILAAALGLFFWKAFYGLALGFLSHGISDALTPYGWAPLAPFNHWKLKGRIKTGSLAETLLAGFLALLIFYLILK